MTQARGRRKPGVRRARLGAATLLAWSFCARASAYHDPMRYSAPVDSGGGGGRFFTGSPADAYTCGVCHTGGTPVHLQISGLPLEGYVPGQRYRISLTWPAGLKAVGANFEITDSAGRPFGQFSMSNRADLGDPDLCLPATRGLPDVFVLPVEGSQRMVATAVACGGGRATVDWTAPMPGSDLESMRIGSIARLNGSLVSTDEDGTVAGDNVTNFSRAIGPAQTAAPVARKVTAGCSAASGATPSAGANAAYALGVLGLLRRLLRRARTRGVLQAGSAACGQTSNRSAHCSD